MPDYEGGVRMEKQNVIELLYDIVKDRKENSADNSYTCYLFEQGINKILKKVGEECAEVIIASKDSNREGVINETSDLIYHLCVLLASLEIEFSDILSELEKRAKKLGNLKVMRVTDKNT
jgi:phosphoribosyl-ATP pyrophosphohydrolase